jgi:hypothetical protein
LLCEPDHCVHPCDRLFLQDQNDFFGSTDNAAKVAGHELNSFNQLISCHIHPLHFPLLALFSFRGYRVIVTSILPINSFSLEYGYCFLCVAVLCIADR